MKSSKEAKLNFTNLSFLLSSLNCVESMGFLVSDYQRSLLNGRDRQRIYNQEVELCVPNSLKAPELLLSSSVLSIADAQIFFRTPPSSVETVFI